MEKKTMLRSLYRTLLLIVFLFTVLLESQAFPETKILTKSLQRRYDPVVVDGSMIETLHGLPISSCFTGHEESSLKKGWS